MFTEVATAGYNFRLAMWQAAAIFSPVMHLAMYGGVATGKTFTGSHYVIYHMLEFPLLTGFIGANTYDQLSQATLRELFYWLDHYKIKWVIDQQPPPDWGNVGRKQFKTYKNILTILHPTLGIPVHAFTRVLGKGDPLRGIEFSWYWIDETRDTPQNTHDIILSRMREDAYMKGLVTTTTNGKDWSYNRFKRGGDNILYGCMHIETIEAVRAGILTQQYYDTLLRSYSPLMAEQELHARHVNVLAGRAYYAAGEVNRRARAPWGDLNPKRERALIVGCDFNFSPAPCIWMVGQLGPDWGSGSTSLHGAEKNMDFSERIHWFGELSEVEISTQEMTNRLLSQYPDFHYSIYGDASGGIGSTSNAGEHDYAQMAGVLRDAGASFTIDYDQRNPLVRDRVENMNGKFCNALNEVSQTWDPGRCPNFDEDISGVGWKKTMQRGRGKLDDGGDSQRTHATDGGGYAVWKVLPIRRFGYLPQPIKTQSYRLASGQ